MDTKIYTDEQKLSIMYEGDKARDATDKIRGFLFQDLITIMCLLQKNVKYVCSEYIEDVDVFFEDNTFEFIQVKYYPKTSPYMKEILTDLYYQYLRLEMLQSTLKVSPKLYIHGKSKVKKLEITDMKTYIGLENNLHKSASYLNVAESVNLLRTDIYSTNKKSEQKEKLFRKMASEKSLEGFVSKFNIVQQEDINCYKQKLMEKLAEEYKNPDEDGDEEKWQLILLGLAISYIQRRYVLENPNFEQLRVDKKEFEQYMKESANLNTEQTIANYLLGLVCEKYGEIINNNEMSVLQMSMLDLIYQNTLQWISEIGKTIEGQYQLLNILSTREASKISGYRKKSINSRLRNIAECNLTFLKFLSYFWKIMLNICQEKVHNENDISTYKELFDPLCYIDSSVKHYICLNFPEDKYVDRCVILPPAAGEFKSTKRNIVNRMVNVSPRPEKWFFQNSNIMQGKNYYDYSTADVSENPTIADLGEDSFYIECMECIGIDEDEWGKKEECGKCIFLENCIKEER